MASLDMEAPAPESKLPDRGLLERTWSFFASVPVATALIFVIAAASMLGTFVVQEGTYNSPKPPAEFYPAQYGPVLGNLLYRTGITHLYTSWWYMTLLFLVGASLVICSLERFVPLWRNVQRPDTTPPEAFVRHLKHRFEYHTPAGELPLAKLETALKSRRYLVVQEGRRLYADKGRWGRWGPYITHIGLLLILVGAMGRAVPGFFFDQFIWVRDGATVKVPGTNWYVRNDQFTVENYPDGSPKTYRTAAVVVDGGVEVKRQAIAMNQPLSYRQVDLYQTSFKQELDNARVSILDRQTGKEIGNLQLDLAQPNGQYTVGDYKLEVQDYFPDFITDNGKPANRSADARNPAFVFEVTPPQGEPYFQWYFVLFPDLEMDPKAPLQFKTLRAESISTTGLTVKKDLGIPVIYLGLTVVAIGVILSFYLTHRRYWAITDGEMVVVGGWANRNPGSLRTEIAALSALLNPQSAPAGQAMEAEER